MALAVSGSLVRLPTYVGGNLDIPSGPLQAGRGIAVRQGEALLAVVLHVLAIRALRAKPGVRLPWRAWGKLDLEQGASP